MSFHSLPGDLVGNTHGVSIMTDKLVDWKNGADVFIIPGGYGSSVEIYNALLIDIIKTITQASSFVLTVCTGTALLAKSGLIDGRNATTNKRAFDWVTTQGHKV
jgi:putative intracellular protease/amidase